MPEYLVVGAGGIGCELLKNLVLSGFENITLVDLDTIDFSNLNRQFLFRNKHIGKSKALVAAEAVKIFNKSAKINAIHDNIFSSDFSQSFFKSFDLVFNALDNLSARKHVNRMCVSTGVPLIEAGTAGYLGQVEPMILDKELPTGINKSECFECQSRQGGQKSYAMCTIRNTPSEPIHCVTWAKFLFNNLFGDKESEDLTPDFSDKRIEEANENGNGAHKPENENSPNKNIWANCLKMKKYFSEENASLDELMGLLMWNSDINTLLSMSSLWTKDRKREKPTPVEKSVLISARSENFEKEGVLKSKVVTNLSSWLQLFIKSSYKLRKRVGIDEKNLSEKKDFLVWDKDDEDAMDFVASASIIRGIIFHIKKIEKMSIFDVKSLAGNIVPAIPTTNAVIAALMVIQGKLMLKDKSKVQNIFLNKSPQGNFNLIVRNFKLNPPNPDCIVCSQSLTDYYFVIQSLDDIALQSLKDDALISKMGMIEPEVEYHKKGAVIITSDEELINEVQMDKNLSAVGVPNGATLRCDDFRQDFTVNLHIDVNPDPKSTSLSEYVTNNYGDNMIFVSDNPVPDDAKWALLYSKASQQAHINTEAQKRKRKNQTDLENEDAKRQKIDENNEIDAKYEISDDDLQIMD